MVELTTSRDMDDLFGVAAPETGPVANAAAGLPLLAPGPAAVPLTRREAREAEGRRRPPAVPEAPARRRASESGVVARRNDGAVAAKTRAVPPAARKLARTEAALLRASTPRAERKHPLRIVANMASVVGLFAVVALPAYATESVSATVDPTTGETTVIAGEGAQSLAVSDDATAATAARDGFHATTEGDLAQRTKDQLRAEQNAAYLASGAREMGDDYPWPYELREFQGGGLSPLNYYYRECVDFVAWRLNRDAGSYSAPFKWTWSTLTPYGGNGGQWMYNWEQKGWPVSNTPIPGAVAYTGGNHVAYVKSVNADGTVTLEEYNYIPGQYGQRTIPASSVVAFLYPPT